MELWLLGCVTNVVCCGCDGFWLFCLVARVCILTLLISLVWCCYVASLCWVVLGWFCHMCCCSVWIAVVFGDCLAMLGVIFV